MVQDGLSVGSFDFLALERVVWGAPAARAVSEEADRLGAKRVFLVASRTLARETDVVDTIRQALGDRCVGLFDSCREHAPRDSVIAAADAARAADPDLVVSVGGGTVLDTVKVMLICLAEGLTAPGQLDACRIRVGEVGGRIVPDIKAPPFRQIAVPTTLSAAEFSDLGGATDPSRGVKDAYTARLVAPRSVILDPRICVHTPEWLWLSTGVRALDHAIEAICSIAPAPIADGAALHALRLLRAALPRTREAPDDLDARLRCQQASWLASLGLSRTPYGASHGIGHSLGAVAGVSHGYTSCVMLPAVLAWNAEHTAERQELVAEALGSPCGNAAAAVDGLIRNLGLPRSLREVGVRRDQFDAIARGALNNMWVRTNPRPITSLDQIHALLEAAW